MDESTPPDSFPRLTLAEPGGLPRELRTLLARLVSCLEDMLHILVRRRG